MIARLCQAQATWPHQFPDFLAAHAHRSFRTSPGADPALRKHAEGHAHALGPGRQAPTVIGSDP